MADRYFKIGNRIFLWDKIYWIDKVGYCNNQDLRCINCLPDFACVSNLCGHCCKHVINGTDLEKNRFIKAVGLNSLGKISLLNEGVIQKYKVLSERVVKDTIIVGLSAASKKVNIFCVGNKKTAGFVDYLSEYFYNGYGGYGIVSSFYKNIDIDSYWMLRVTGNYYTKKSKRIEGEAVKHFFNMDIYDFEPVDTINASFKRIHYLKKPKVRFDTRIKSISALYIYYHDRVENDIEVNFYKTVNKKQNSIVEQDDRFVMFNEEKLNFSIILLFIELFYKNKLALKLVYPSEFDDENNRIVFNKYINHNHEDEFALLIQYCKRIKNTISSDIFNAWNSLCEDIKVYEEDKKYKEYEEDDGDDRIIARFTAYNIARRFAYYYMSVLILWKIKKENISDYGIDIGFIKGIRKKLKNCPKIIREWWDLYDSLFCLSEKIKAVLPE